MGVAVLLCRVLLAGLFLFAAYNKLVGTNAPQIFSSSVTAFMKRADGTVAMPDWAVRLTVGVVPWVEVIAGVLLLLGIWTRAAATVLSGLLVVFIALVIQAIVRDLDLSCGCFGKLSPFCPEKVSWCNVIQNSTMLGLGLVILLTPTAKLRSPVSDDAAGKPA